EVLAPEPGWEAALAAALGPLLDAWVASDEAAATAAATGGEGQRTVLFPAPAPAPAALPGSLLEHVRPEAGFETVVRRLLGRVPVGEPGVTREGLYREPGLVRAGADPRVHL